jgi:hypothetical protein
MCALRSVVKDDVARLECEAFSQPNKPFGKAERVKHVGKQIQAREPRLKAHFVMPAHAKSHVYTDQKQAKSQVHQTKVEEEEYFTWA